MTEKIREDIWKEFKKFFDGGLHGSKELEDFFLRYKPNLSRSTLQHYRRRYLHYAVEECGYDCIILDDEDRKAYWDMKVKI